MLGRPAFLLHLQLLAFLLRSRPHSFLNGIVRTCFRSQVRIAKKLELGEEVAAFGVFGEEGVVEGELVEGEGAGFVGAEDGNGGEFFDCGESVGWGAKSKWMFRLWRSTSSLENPPLDNHILCRQLLCAHRHRHRKHRRQPNRNGRNHQNHDLLEGFQDGHVVDADVDAEDDDDEADRDDDEEVADCVDDFLELEEKERWRGWRLEVELILGGSRASQENPRLISAHVPDPAHSSRQSTSPPSPQTYSSPSW